MKFIFRTILNFFKVCILSTVMVLMCFLVVIKSNIDISYPSFLAMILLFFVLIQIFAYKRNYITFRRGEIKNNLISIVFIIMGLLWVIFVTYLSAVFSISILIFSDYYI